MFHSDEIMAQFEFCDIQFVLADYIFAGSTLHVFHMSKLASLTALFVTHKAT